MLLHLCLQKCVISGYSIPRIQHLLCSAFSGRISKTPVQDNSETREPFENQCRIGLMNDCQHKTFMPVARIPQVW